MQKQNKCKYCGNEITIQRKSHEYKYCSQKCYRNARFGEEIADGISGVRNPQSLEAIKLCRMGLTQAEAARRTGIEVYIIATWMRKYGEKNYSAIYADKVCGHCGKSMLGMPYLSRRKYCSKSCLEKALYARKNPERKKTEFTAEFRVQAMELYWGGLEGRQISGHLGIAEGTMYCWIHYYGNLRERKAVAEILELLPIEERLNAAKKTSEWRQILRQTAPKGESASVHIYCGRINGQAGGNYLASIVSDVLKRDPCDGATYAFCSQEKELVSTIRWNNGTFFYTKQPKAHGRYIWPDAEVGLHIDIRKNEFEYLLSLSQKRGQKPSFA